MTTVTRRAERTEVAAKRASDPLEQCAEVAVYRPFFIGGMLTVLTAGCLLGAIALLGIALRGDFLTGGWTPYILAHANSQLYGWVGLFVMGFALQNHPPRVGRAALYHKMAMASLVLLCMAIVLRFIAEPLVQVNRTAGISLGVATAVMQAMAVAIFIANIGMTRHRAKDAATLEAGLPWQSKFVFASLGWWMLVAAVEPWVFTLSHQSDRMASIMFVATWFVPYREAQFIGFVPMMIFGVALARLSSDFDFPEAQRTPAEIGFGLWNAALLLRIVGWLMLARMDMTATGALIYHAGGALLGTAAAFIVIASRLYETPARTHRSHKFLRAAFGWLIIAGLLMALEPIHLSQIGALFSHAYTGGIRHALTVGFISQMILGVAMHFVPRLRMSEYASDQAPLWSVFWLLNIGNTLRVVFEILTDYTPGAFLPMGVTGFIELTGLIIWAVNVGRPLLKTASKDRLYDPVVESS